MTEPTQTQIDAALKEYQNPKYDTADDETIIKAALTAAAGVEDEYLKEVNRELAAVALGIKDEAIERCAQVADNYKLGGGELGMSGIHKKIAARIRALKDKP
jgi:hypothetical protein